MELIIDEKELESLRTQVDDISLSEVKRETEALLEAYSEAITNDDMIKADIHIKLAFAIAEARDKAQVYLMKR